MNAVGNARPQMRVSPNQAKILIGLFIAIMGLVDVLFIPSNIILPILYPIAVASCVWTRSTRFLWGTAIFSSAAAVLVAQLGRPPLVTNMPLVIWINHLTTILTTLLVSALAHRTMVMQDHSEQQLRAGELKAAQLEEANAELGQREEEIVRQNEELQSQTEELERQTEELRETNEELAAWEKRLEQLLELARNLTAETSRSEVFSQICEALGRISDSHSTALIERHGDTLKIQCHFGFGPEGPEIDRFPLEGSFSSKVLAVGQTGYMEDLKLRPDLTTPQPRSGIAFRAVLATPLRVEGRTIGTIEAYSTTPRAWSTTEVAMIESLAIQAGRSIQNAELVEGINQERRRFEAVFRTVPFGMVVADDAAGDRLRVNPTAAALFQIPSDENISSTTPAGKRLQRQFRMGTEELTPDRLPIALALRGQEVHGLELEFLPFKGQNSILYTSSAPIYDGQAEICGAVCAFVDITTHKLMSRELELRRREAEEASLRKTRFLAAVSHDIRTPANAINLMAEIIRRIASDPTKSAEIAEMAQRLQANTHSLMELVGDVLDVARFDTGKMDLTVTEFSLAELIDQEVHQVEPLARDKNLELIGDQVLRPVWLRTDRVKLGRVIGNLLGNAIKFTEDGTVRVSLIPTVGETRSVSIRVSDTGIGMPESALASIFDEFSQLHNPARDRSQGSGLGLAICHRLLTLIGGTIAVESEVGRGSVFIVTLPESLVVMRTDISNPSFSTAATLQSAAPRLPELQILLVEDHTTTRDGTAHLLRDEGALVTEAPDGRTALKLLGENQFDVILLDMMLPDLDGREILRFLQSRPPMAFKGVLVLTGDVTEGRIQEVKSLGADGIIAKPIDIIKLLQTLQSFQ